MEPLEADRAGSLPHPRAQYGLWGHGDAARRLAGALETGRMPTAWLIAGPPGIGKATLAYRFARRLLGAAPKAGDENEPLASDPGRQAARLIEAQAHPDLLVLRRPWDDKTKRLKSQIPIDEVRRIHGFFGRHAGHGGYRVCLVDTADDLSTSAANALLKTLEEPPARAVFLLLSAAPQRLLATIRSRARRLLLKPLPDDAIAAILTARLPALTPAERAGLAALAEGSPGRALLLAEEGGLALYRELADLLGALPRPDPAKLHALAERLARPGEEHAYDTTFLLLSGLLTRLVRQGAGLPARAGMADEPRLLARLAEGTNLERWVDVWEKVRALVDRADVLALDRRQVVLSTFAALSETAAAGRGSA